MSNNILEFKYFSYNYDIEVEILKLGKSREIRFMYYNVYSSIASNMNDIYSNETVYKINKNEKFKFTVTGEYQYFFVYSDAKIELKITKSDKKTPTYICKKKSCKCMCYEDNNVGYIKINNQDIPVYVKKTTHDTVTTYLYPEFSSLRELFLNATVNNSLPIHEYISPTSNNQIIKYNDYKQLKYVANYQVGYVQRLPNVTALYLLNPIKNSLIKVINSSNLPDFIDKKCQIEQLVDYDRNKHVYKYEWDGFKIGGNGYYPFIDSMRFYILRYKSPGIWPQIWEYRIPEAGPKVNEITFPGGTFYNEDHHTWLWFDIEGGRQIFYPNGINITVTIVDKK